MSARLLGGFFLLFTALLTGCSGNDAIPKLVPIQEFEQREFKQDISSTDFMAPKVDILMVIDGSGSMGPHIANVERNIDRFLDAIVSARLDYRIAITIAGYVRAGEHQRLYGNLRSTENSGLFHTNDNLDTPPYYVTNRTPDVLNVLKSRVRVGTANDAQETFFGPVLDAITHAQSSPHNMGFFREDAYLIPIFIMDAEDQTRVNLQPLSPFDFYNQLLAFKRSKELIIPYAVLIPTAYGTSPPCSRNGEGQPHRVEEFLHMAGGVYYDLCSPSFGLELSKLADDLTGRVSGAFRLNAVPDPRTIEVYLGEELLPNHPERGWIYNPDTNEIRLGLEIDAPIDEEAQVRVTFKPANTFQQ